MRRFDCGRRLFDLRVPAIFLAMAILGIAPALSKAQFVQQQAVGGISIDANGLLDSASVDSLARLSRMRQKLAGHVPVALNGLVPYRKISLRHLDEAIGVALKSGKPIPEDVAFLGGLEGIRYVFVYPEQKDIVLVGPADGWKVDASGNVVGVGTGRPVMLLDDLLVALRTASGSAQAGITCSIDPTKEGLDQLRSHVAQLHRMDDPQATATGIEQALGRQQISFTGVPVTSHFAAVLVAADYRMKRLAMNFEKSPVTGMPSFLQMLTGGGVGLSNMMPRWWLEPKYDSVIRDPEGMAWELDGTGVKCMTEEDFMTATGGREHSGKPNRLAQRWADNMTSHYEELSVAQPIFGELRNCMELALVGALVAREHLTERSGCSLPILLQETSLKTAELPAPTHVDSRVSMLKKGRNWVISASGGVSIYPQEAVAKAQKSDAPMAARTKALPADNNNWVWN